MLPLTAEWVAKAEADFATATRELRARRLPNYDAACFHAQQCAEKYLKARLQEARIAFSRTHDLVTLMNLLQPPEPVLLGLLSDLRLLSAFGVAFRYPGATADRAMAQDAVRRCRTVRAALRTSLYLPSLP
ncbi:MAG: HEPN domain-containing protein [Chloroflexales bacterium]